MSENVTFDTCHVYTTSGITTTTKSHDLGGGGMEHNAIHIVCKSWHTNHATGVTS